jgi:methylmalonyl-CoA mutase C-terminal domain/subunit
MALRDAGMEVVYTGLHRSIADIVDAAIQEDVEVIGLSVLSGAHLPLAGKLMTRLEEAGVTSKLVVLGGTIPPDDVPSLRELGVQAVFPVGTPLSYIPERIRELLESHSEQRAT